MVIINQKKFNEDMDRYIGVLRKKDSISFMSKINFLSSSNEQIPKVSDTEVSVEYKEPSFFRRLLRWRRKEKLNEMEEYLDEGDKIELEEIEGEIEAIEDEETDLEGMEEELEERKEGLMSRLFQKIAIFRSKKAEDYGDEDFEDEHFDKDPVIEEEVKEALKIAHNWLGHLSPIKTTAFKRSDDFKRYKEILLKYGLVKEKNADLSVDEEGLRKEINKELAKEKEKVKNIPKKAAVKSAKKK
ncbi:MAG: hypothetical protein ABH828_05500 [archaeon]